MEGVYWFRLGAILAMFLGSIYVLMPTIFQVEPEDAVSAQDATSRSGAVAPELTLFIDVPIGDDADTALEAVRARLKGFEVAVDRVDREGQAVRVVLSPGASREQVASALVERGQTALYDLRAVLSSVAPTPGHAELPADLVAAIDAAGLGTPEASGLSGAAPAGAPVLESFTVGGPTPRRLTIAPPAPIPPGPYAFAVDGQVVGLAWSDTDPAELLHAHLFSSDADLLRLLRSGPLPDGLGLRARVVQSVVKGTDARAEQVLPPWLVALLPDTRMNLGIDLQGGLDLTLQVELEEAVLSQVSRDATYLKEQAEREGVVIDRARADTTDPIIWVETSTPLSQVQRWFLTRMAEYVYSESTNATTHGFKMSGQRVAQVEEQAVEQVLETLRKRVDATGVKEPSVVQKGGGRISVQLPGQVDLEAAVAAIGTTAVLEFRMVDMDADPSDLARMLSAAEEALPPDQFAHDRTVVEWLWRQGRLPHDRIVMWEYEDTPEGQKRSIPMILVAEIVLTGNDINGASVEYDRNNLPFVSLEFKPRGSRIFCTVTGEHVDDRFAIILDGEIKSAPVIQERICGGRASITLGGSLDAMQEANTLSLVLRTGSLNAPVAIGEVREVGSTLGRDAINAGVIATVIGSVLVYLFMILWYRSAGVIASVTLTLNVLLALAVLAMFGATLTLPGIAGIAITVAMAVDANVIVYERIREEMAVGQHVRRAVDTGFEKALSAILDGNITTAIAGVVLYSYGTGPIRGFAVTLLIGICTTLVTALFVTRSLMEWATRSSNSRVGI